MKRSTLPTRIDVARAMQNQRVAALVALWTRELRKDMGGDAADLRARLSYAVGIGYTHRLYGGLQTGFTNPKETPFYQDLKSLANQACENAGTGGPKIYECVLNALVAAVNVGLGLGAGLDRPIPVLRVG
jgi:hypothetical protein